MNLVNFALHKLMPIVRAVMGSPGDGVAEFIGSAFLLKNDNKYFLITAAHVLDYQNDKYQLFVDSPDEGLVRIEGEAIVSRSNEKRRLDDKLDTAIISLTSNAAIKFSGTHCLTLDNFDINYNIIYNKGYIVVGFPVSKNKGNIITANKEAMPYGFHALEAQQDKYIGFGIDKFDNILLDFDSKNVFSENGEQRHAVGLRGLSGAPVWGITESGECKVVSLLIGHHQCKTVVTSKVGGIISKIFR